MKSQGKERRHRNIQLLSSERVQALICPCPFYGTKKKPHPDRLRFSRLTGYSIFSFLMLSKLLEQKQASCPIPWHKTELLTHVTHSKRRRRDETCVSQHSVADALQTLAGQPFLCACATGCVLHRVIDVPFRVEKTTGTSSRRQD